MKITAIESFVCDGGLREFGFVKVSTDEGVTGWAETYDSHTSAALAAALQVPRTVAAVALTALAIFAIRYVATPTPPGPLRPALATGCTPMSSPIRRYLGAPGVLGVKVRGERSGTPTVSKAMVDLFGW